ncbi:MAG: FAD-dependent oxidoreductase [Ignavibacteriales bacterium]|nr:FAD-dependent oxidoreductase [Ignavibacteriales bacterium]
MKSDVVVVGCGISGLSCAVRLLENGFSVKVIAKELPPETTSATAAAIWFPYRVESSERMKNWSRITFDEYMRLASRPGTSVTLTQLIELHEQQVPEPWWKDVVRSFRRATKNELPERYADAFVAEVPLIDTSLHLDYLLERIKALGGTIELRNIESFSAITPKPRLVINCAGLGSRELAQDPSVFPIRGQVVIVKKPPVEVCYADVVGRHSLAYIVPRTSDCVLGGTSQENDWNLKPDELTAAEILQKCRIICPSLGNPEVLGHKVGLRPGRNEVRLELERISSECSVIHNYGHGGAGFTLCWGCADDVVALAKSP